MIVSRSLAETIKTKLEEAFSPVALSVEDESTRHAGHAGYRQGGESHFEVRIVSTAFEGLSRIERQRSVYNILSDEFKAGMHALSLVTLTPDEAAPPLKP